MASPTPRTWSHVSLFSARKPTTPCTQPRMTASVPEWAFVELWRSFIETMEPSAQTPPVFDVVAPLSDPMNTCLVEVIQGWYEIRTPCRPTARPQESGPD